MNKEQIDALLSLAASCKEKPYIFFRNGHFRISLDYLIDLAKTKAKSEVVAIIAFGSAVREPNYRLEESGWWIFKSQNKIYIPPNDIDVMIVTQSMLPAESHLPIMFERQRWSDYGSWFDSQMKQEGLHLFVTSLNGLKEAMDNGESVAKSVLRDGVMIYGNDNFPYQLRQPVWDRFVCEIPTKPA